MTSKKILVATEFGESSRSVLHEAIDLARRLGDSLELVHSCGPSLTDEVRLDAIQNLDRLKRYVSGYGLAVSTRIVDGPASTALLAVIESDRPELVVVGTHGRGAL